MAVTFWLFHEGYGYALVGVAVALPILGATLGSIVGGWLADRIGPLTLLARLNGILALLATALLASTVFGRGVAWMVIFIGTTYSIVNGMTGPGQRSLTPNLLDEEDYQHGNAVYSGVTNISSLVGPLLGGVVFSIGGLGLAVGINIAALAVGAMTLIGLSRGLAATASPQAPGSHAPFARSVSAALKYTAQHHWLLLLFAVDAIMDLITSGQFQVGFRALANQNGGAGAFGLIMAAYGLGAIAGAMLGSRLKAKSSTAYRMVMLSNIAQAPLIALLPFVSMPMMLGMLLPIGALNGVSNVLYMTLVFRNTPQEMAGRISALFLAASLSLQPVGIFVFGLLAGGGWIGTVFIGTAVAMILVSVIAVILWNRVGLPPTAADSPG